MEGIFWNCRAFTTNPPAADFLPEDALVAMTHDGEPIPLDHGGLARLIVPQWCAWKRAKWVSGIGSPDLWREDRYSW